MSRRPLRRGEIVLSGVDIGAGPAVLFQHGLGADQAQVAEIFPNRLSLRRLTLECRAQGLSEAGPPQCFSITTFADDAVAFLDAANVEGFAAGGISMGAAIALRLAVRFPDRVRALILVRPSWLWGRAPQNMHPFAEVAAVLRNETDSAAALAAFDRSETARRLARDAPDNIVSLRKFFGHARPLIVASLLEAIADDGPGVSEDEIAALRAPTLVIGTVADLIHPIEFARTLADRIPTAFLVEVTPKAIDRVGYVREVQEALEAFLNERILPVA